MTPPFKPGDRVTVRHNKHMGVFIVDTCEWYDAPSMKVPPYWLCYCTGEREPVDWSKIPPGATGIITGSNWQGPATSLKKVEENDG